MGTDGNISNGDLLIAGKEEQIIAFALAVIANHFGGKLVVRVPEIYHDPQLRVAIEGKNVIVSVDMRPPTIN